jgi:hypothetical protein
MLSCSTRHFSTAAAIASEELGKAPARTVDEGSRNARDKEEK